MTEKNSKPGESEAKQESAFLQIFNYIGGALIFFGIAYLIAANWFYLNEFAKIFSTLGAAIAAFLVAVLLHLGGTFRSAQSAFFMLSGLVLPIGLYVTADILQLRFLQYVIDCLISGICFLVFLTSFLVLRRTVLLLFSIIFGSFFFTTFIDYLSHSSDLIFTNLFEYEMIVLGISYIFLGYYLKQEKRYPLTGPLYFFGSLFALSASYFLSSSFFNETVVYWKILTAIFIVLAFALAVPLKSKSFLYFGAAFLVLYVSDLSYKFARLFGDLGWSLLLVAMGLLLMLLGYLIFYIHKKMRNSE